MSEGTLRLEGLTKRFGGVTAVDDVTLSFPAGSASAVIGPNGAGKSTLLKMISAVYTPTSGQVHLGETRLDTLAPHQLARHGVGFAHQIPRPFRQLTVRQNVSVATAAARRGTDVDDVLERTGLMAHADRTSGSLGLLDLKRIEVARALACAPQLVLLDEIAAGLVGRELEEAIELIRSIHATGVTVILVEHVEAVVRSLVDRVVVLDWGELIADGTPAQIAEDSRVREVYLGGNTPTHDHTLAREASGLPPLLEVRDLEAGYGGQLALHGVTLTVPDASVVAVLGANGAGKSTLCATISGLVPAVSGTVTLREKNSTRDLTSQPAHVRNAAGIAHCPEGRRLFAGLSVLDNLKLGAYGVRDKSEVETRIQETLAVFPRLKAKLSDLAESLSGGQQQMVAVGRALMSRPRLLICDEVSLGLSPKAIDELYEGLDLVRASGRSLLLIEQNVHRCLDFADQAYVLNRGRISFSGEPSRLKDDTTLDTAYFGQPATS